jgi:hypothetical protein
MTTQDIDILIKYLIKAVVPQADHDAFFQAVQRLEALKTKAQKAA